MRDLMVKEQLISESNTEYVIHHITYSSLRVKFNSQELKISQNSNIVSSRNNRVWTMNSL